MEHPGAAVMRSYGASGLRLGDFLGLADRNIFLSNKNSFNNYPSGGSVENGVLIETPNGRKEVSFLIRKRWVSFLCQLTIEKYLDILTTHRVDVAVALHEEVLSTQIYI